MGGTVLIVDDDPHCVEILSTILDSAGARSHSASNGRQALAAIQLNRPALVFLDLQMPVLDGPGVVRELTAQGISLPIILMSAHPSLAQLARELGVTAYLPKPFNSTHVQELLGWTLTA